LVGGCAGQRRRTDGIAGCENSRNVGLESAIDFNMPAAADCELQPVQADAVQVGDAAECREHDVGAQGLAALELHLHLRETVEARIGHFGAALILAAHCSESAQESRSQRGVQKSQRLRRLVDDRDGTAQCGKYRCVLASDHAAAQHDHGARYVGQAQDGVAVENMLMIHGDARNVPRARAGGEQDARRAHNDSRTVQALHLDTIRVQEDRAPADQLDAVARKLSLQIAVLSGDDDVDAVQQCR